MCLAALSTLPNAINDRGDISGYYEDATGLHVFIWTKDGEIIVLDRPGGESTTAFGINASRHVVGSYVDPDSETTQHHVWADGAFHDIDIPGAELNFPQGINAKGQVVGAYALPNTNLRGFVVRP